MKDSETGNLKKLISGHPGYRRAGSCGMMDWKAGEVTIQEEPRGGNLAYSSPATVNHPWIKRAPETGVTR